MKMIEITEATIDDTNKISALVSALAQKYIGQDFSEQGRKILLSSMRPDAIRSYLQSGFRYHLAKIEGRLVGVIGIRDNHHLYHLFVASEYQRQGIARKLWQVALEVCLETGNPGKFTVNSSKYAQVVYEKLGFVAQSEPQERNGVVFIPMQLVISN